MLVDININITDNDGNLVHHFEKSFQDEDSISLEKLNNGYHGESFESFLSEYMSLSGLMVRDRLISSSFHSDKLTSSSSSDATISSDPGTLCNIENRELAYKISIGRNNVFVGRIPLIQIPRKEEADSITEDTESSYQKVTFSKRDLDSLDYIFPYAMVNAIAKYEANLYPVMYEQADEYAAVEISASTG